MNKHDIITGKFFIPGTENIWFGKGKIWEDKKFIQLVIDSLVRLLIEKDIQMSQEEIEKENALEVNLPYFYPLAHTWPTVVYDLRTQILVEPKDEPYYEVLFAFQLMSINLLDVDDFLEYQFNNYQSFKKGNFTRFVKLIFRKYKDYGFVKNQPERVATIDEWLESKGQLAQTLYDALDIKWIGTNETEFIQLIYSLSLTKRLTNSKNEVTKLVEDMAKLLNINLSKGWKSNHSTGIHKRNSDYAPLIFDDLAQKYNQYISQKIENKKKK